jgi:excinuclease UvrABC ATPase subunit
MALPVGGYIEAEGQPEQVAKVPTSHTGHFLPNTLDEN